MLVASIHKGRDGAAEGCIHYKARRCHRRARGGMGAYAGAVLGSQKGMRGAGRVPLATTGVAHHLTQVMSGMMSRVCVELSRDCSCWRRHTKCVNTICRQKRLSMEGLSQGWTEWLWRWRLCDEISMVQRSSCMLVGARTSYELWMRIRRSLHVSEV